MAEAAKLGSGRARVLVSAERDFFGGRTLAGLEAAGLEVAAVVLRRDADASADRYLARRNPAFSVAAFLDRKGLQPVLVETRRDWPLVLRAIEELGVTLLVNVHFPWRVPEAVLDRLPGRALNLHPALLPACRGPHPFAALLGEELADRHGGATLHVMTPTFDQGPIVAQEAVPLGPARDVMAWQLAIARAYARLVGEPLADYLAGRRAAVPQDESQASLARIENKGGRLNIDESLSAAEALRRAQLFGQLRTLKVAAGGKLSRAMLPARVLGPPTGKPPRLGLWRLSFDVADARLSLGRRWPGAGRRQRRRLWRAVARAEP